VQRQVFEDDLAEKTWVFLLIAGLEEKIRGFSALHIYDATVQGVPIRALYSGDTVIDRACWSSLELEKNWIDFAIRISAADPQVRWFWFFISNSYRSFRFLPVYARRYYPNPDTPTPSFEQAVLDTLARQKFGDAYDASQGVVRLQAKSIHLRPGMGDIGERELRDRRISFFAERNPEWREGVDLACLTEFTPENFQPVVWRFISEEAKHLLSRVTGH
jgi:hypothetical protein